MMFIKVLLGTYLLLKPGFSEKKRTINLTRSWSAAILTEGKVTEFCGCLKYIFQRVGLRKENEIPCLETDFDQSYEM